MGVRYKDGKIEDLDFTINLTNNCNLSCSYCPLINDKKYISVETLDDYISFFLDNSEEIYTKCINVVIIFFGGECLLNFDKIEKFIKKTNHLKIKYVVYTNGLLITQDIINRLNIFNISRRIIFAISVDGDNEISSKYRFRKDNQLMAKLKTNIELIKTNNYDFSVSKVILEDDKIDLFKNMKFLHDLGPNKLFFLPVTYFYKNGFSKESIFGIIKGFVKFFKYLEKKGYSRLNILEYLGIPDTFNDIRDMYKVDKGLFGDIDGNIYGILDGYSGYNTSKLFKKKELDDIKIGNIKDNKKLLDVLVNYNEYEKKWFKIGKEWNKRNFPNDDKIMRMLNIFFVKELLMYRYKPQD